MGSSDLYEQTLQYEVRAKIYKERECRKTLLASSFPVFMAIFTYYQSRSFSSVCFTIGGKKKKIAMPFLKNLLGATLSEFQQKTGFISNEETY